METVNKNNHTIIVDSVFMLLSVIEKHKKKFKALKLVLHELLSF